MVGSRLERILTRLSVASAMLGGVILLALIVMSVLSITGRALVFMGFGPVPGDFELVESGTALAVFCFLPWCQLNAGHVTVDLLVPVLGPRRDAMLSFLHNLLMTLIAAFITWRAVAGMQDKMQYNETTFILQYPVWWGYAACLPFAVLFVIVAGFTVWRSLGAARRPGTRA